jgi:hypothetical protein
MPGRALSLAALLGVAAFAALAVPAASAHPCFEQTAFPNCGACPAGLFPHYHASADDPANPYCVSVDVPALVIVPALDAEDSLPLLLTAWWAGSTGVQF